LNWAGPIFADACSPSRKLMIGKGDGTELGFVTFLFMTNAASLITML
jgi:hypothetical protein